MRPRFVPLGALVGIGALTACGKAPAPPPPADVLPARFDADYLARLDSLDAALATLASLPPHPDSAAARHAFRQARAAYKRVEYLLEFEDRIRAALLNAPPLPIVDEDDHTNVIPPHGLQVIESAVYPRPAPDFGALTAGELRDLRRVVAFIREDSSYRAARTWPVPFEAARMEVARVVTLGLAGFDATVSRDGLHESAEALRGVRDGLGAYEEAMLRRDSAGWHELQRALGAGIDALEAAPDFDKFDRLDFIVRFARPIAAGLARVHRSLRLPNRRTSIPGPRVRRTSTRPARSIPPGSRPTTRRRRRRR